jgi:hypothetical protein
MSRKREREKSRERGEPSQPKGRAVKEGQKKRVKREKSGEGVSSSTGDIAAKDKNKKCK